MKLENVYLEVGVGHGIVSYSDQCGTFGEIRLDRVESIHFDDEGGRVVMFSGDQHLFVAPDGAVAPDGEDTEWWETAMDALNFRHLATEGAAT